MNQIKRKVVIIGAGPAGLTAALELARDGRMVPVVLEATDCVGGISRTVVYKGNRMDIGGHRFFSKSEWVMRWWGEILPIASDQAEFQITYRGQSQTARSNAAVGAVAATGNDTSRVMLVRNRLSRIYFLRRYFDYPIKLNLNTLRNLGAVRLIRIGLSYSWSVLFPRRAERSLEDFLVNRFGAELYRTFFRDYTEKVWGVKCHEISADWGAQRIKGLSVLETLKHALRNAVGMGKDSQVKTSLIERFLYPRLGPGQLWEEVARKVVELGGEIRFGTKVTGFRREGDRRVAAVLTENSSGVSGELGGDYFISTMPVKDLVLGLQPPAPEALRKVAHELPYRDFITVGLLLRGMKPNRQAQSVDATQRPADNWIYIQEPDVRIGRLQVFNNWSPDLVADPQTVWLGLEYFCQEGDELWSMANDALLDFAARELEKIGMIDHGDVIDGTVIRVPKTYPAYFGAYREFPRLREFLDRFENLYLVGRNGMHRYNNQDHSMLTAKFAVEAILHGSSDKAPIWAVNVDDDYHEEK